MEYWHYRYDLLNRLIEVKKNGTIVAEYGYSPDGLREVKRANGVTTHYVFEGTEPIFEKKIETNTVKSYVYALGKHLARVDGVIGDVKCCEVLVYDRSFGSVRAVTDESGQMVYQSDFEPFGKQVNKNKLDQDFEEDDLGFTGKGYDGETGLYYFNARWYDQYTGRFTQEDPGFDPNNPNLFVYARNNPLTVVDPTGLEGETAQPSPLPTPTPPPPDPQTYLTTMGFQISATDKNTVTIAVIQFQVSMGLNVSGKIDDETKAKLKECVDAGKTKADIIKDPSKTKVDTSKMSNGNLDTSIMIKVKANNGEDTYMTKEAAITWAYMVAAASQDSKIDIKKFYPAGKNYLYRDYDAQVSTWNDKKQEVTNAYNKDKTKGFGKEVSDYIKAYPKATQDEAITYVAAIYAAKPNFTNKKGTSNHGFGIAEDFGFTEGSYELTWMETNAATYGFVPYLKDDGTYREVWHWTYKP